MKRSFRIRRFMSKYLGVSLLSSASKRDVPGNMGQVPRANSFRHAPFPNALTFGKGVSEKAFHLEVPRGVPFLFRRQKGTHLGHLKLLFQTSDTQKNQGVQGGRK